MLAITHIKSIHNFGAGRFFSVDNPGKPASNSEISRWVDRKCVSVNGLIIGRETIIDFDTLQAICIFPNNSKRRITIL